MNSSVGVMADSSRNRHIVPMNFTRTAFLLGATLLTVGCAGDAGPIGPEGPQGPPGGIDQSLSPSDKLVTTLGGKPALAALQTISATITDTRSLLDEGYLPEDGAAAASTFAATLRWDLGARNLRIDYQRAVGFPFPGTYTYTELLRADGGWRDGIDNFFGAPPGALASERWASARRQQLFLHPEVLARELASGKLTGKDAGIGVIGGVLHHRLEVADTVSPLTLWIEVGTGRLSKLSTVENEYLRSDVAVEAFYSDWQPVAGGVSLPRRAVLTVDGEVVHEELRTAITMNPVLEPTVFAVPGGGQPSVITNEAKRGERSHQFYEMFSAVGIPLAGGQTSVQANEFKPGVWHLSGGSHNSLVIEQASGVVVVEAPLYQDRSRALLSWISTKFPGKPVTHAVATHFHGDHSAGLRTFVAAGATVVAGDAALGLYRRVFSARRTVEPDDLSAAPRLPTLRGVAPGEVITLADATRPVKIYTVNTTHAADMIVAVVNGVLFVSDIFSPGIPASPAALRELRQAITDNPTIAVERLAGGHGGTATLAELDALINGTPTAASAAR
jgi:glyoxylase-like metal-dependent hydrolase (beta-lactamase superfamily II)